MPAAPKQPAPSPARRAWFNSVLNVLWTALALLPLSIYCYQEVGMPRVTGFALASLPLLWLPPALMRRLQLSQEPGLYQRLGVPVFGHFAQDGGLVNTLIRRRYPQYRHVGSRHSALALARGSVHRERFHWCLLVFFGLISFSAARHGHWGWAGLLTLLNVGYNLYPVWLQQYLRVRLGERGRL